MKVKDLMKQLKKMDPEADVMVKATYYETTSYLYGGEGINRTFTAFPEFALKGNYWPGMASSFSKGKYKGDYPERVRSAVLLCKYDDGSA